jgi:lysylphosphatidylglycerol synthetase-like protein (DUF2156 family)
MIQTQRPLSHGTVYERRGDSTTGQHLETLEVVPPCGQTGQTERRALLQWRQALQILAVLLCLVVVVQSCRYLWRAIDAHQLALAWQSLRATTWRQLLLACLCVLLAYGAHIIFEYLGWRLVKVPIRFRTLCGIALIGAGITNAVGQYWLSGSAVRLRLSRQTEVPLGPLVQVTIFVVSSTWVGYLLVAGVLIVWLPAAQRLMRSQAFPATAMALVGLGVPAVYLMWAASRRPVLARFHPPTLSTCLAQIAASLLRVCAIAGAFYALAPSWATLRYVDVVAALVSAMLVAAVGQVPGAVGVLEATMVPALRDTLPVAAVLAALIAFRVLFYLVPLGLAVGALAVWTIRSARAVSRATARTAPPAARPHDTAAHPADRARAPQSPRSPLWRHAAALVQAYPRSKAYLALLGETEYMFDPAQRAFLMFGRYGRSWICLGDPVGPSERVPELITHFIHHVRANGGRPVFHEVGDDSLALYRRHHLAVVQIAEEARLRLHTFSLEGHRNQTLRNAVRSAERHGVTCALLDDDEIARSIPALRHVSHAWLAARTGRELGFSMGRFDPAYLRHFRVAAARWHDTLVAFVTVWAGHVHRELFVDLMRVGPEAPRGTMDSLFVQVIRWAQTAGFEVLNLGMAPLLTAPGSWHRPSSWPIMVARQWGERFYHMRGLRQFKEKFHPDWSARYLAAPPGVNMLLAQLDLARLIFGGWTGLVARGETGSARGRARAPGQGAQHPWPCCAPESNQASAWEASTSRRSRETGAGPLAELARP